MIPRAARFKTGAQRQTPATEHLEFHVWGRREGMQTTG
jgi:hypothetical protein